jgi:hypothetical protein
MGGGYSTLLMLVRWKRSTENFGGLNWMRKITVRGKRSLQFMEVRQKKKYEIILPEESRVTRDLREFRKHNQ